MPITQPQSLHIPSNCGNFALPPHSMLEQFRQNIKTLGLIPGQHKVLAAVSGGADSVVMLQLLQQAGFELGIAHVNFGLRGEESNAETTFVNQLAENLNLALYIEMPETKTTAENEGVSIQMAARKLRYDFFQNIATDFQYDFIATAHHADDDLENLFIYLLRNNIHSAFAGIPAVNGVIVRPMLPFTKEQIVDYAIKNNWTWCEDSSNEKDDYLRNKIRHHIIPGLKYFYPDVIADYQSISQEYDLWIKKLHQKYDDVLNANLHKNAQSVFLNKSILDEINSNQILEYYFLQLGFNKNEIVKMIELKRTGSFFLSNAYRVMIEREGWRIFLVDQKVEVTQVEIQESELPAEIQFGNYFIKIDVTQDCNLETENTWHFDIEKVHFPLQARAWQNGDKMQVFGMQGSKKLSDIFIDSKTNLSEKDSCPVICSGSQILGLIPLRRSAAAPINTHSRSVLKITWKQNYR